MKEGKIVHLKMIEKFYTQVIGDFWRKLEDERKRGDFPEQIIEHLKERLLHELERPQDLLRLKYKNEKKREQEKREQKERQLQILKNEEEPVVTAKCEVEPVKQPNLDEQDDDEYFEPEPTGPNGPNLEEPMVKAQDISEPKQQQESVEDLEGIQKQLIIAGANEKVEMYLIGQSLKKKYVAKTEKIIIDLEDVFVKFRDREEFFKKINCNFVKIKPEEVKPQTNENNTINNTRP